MQGSILMAGFMEVLQPILNSIFGELSRKDEAIMAIHTAPSMRMELSWPIIKIRIIGGITRGKFHLVAGVIYRKHLTVR